jgi:hypothetical protein
MPKQKIYAPNEIPKYLHRKGINVPLPEKKERKKRVVKDITKKELTEVVGKMLAEATSPDTPTVPVVETPVVETLVVPVEKKKRTRTKEDVPKTKAMRGPNSWQIHLKDFRAKNPTITFKQAMADARATYVKA